MGLKAIDFYALSCGSFRKKARHLIKTAQRKSQTPLCRRFVRLLEHYPLPRVKIVHTTVGT